jgi:hypothetical protein
MCFFQRNPPWAGEIPLRGMKSLRDEILLRRDRTRRISFHLKPQAEDFIRFCSDFIVQSTISFVIYKPAP